MLPRAREDQYTFYEQLARFVKRPYENRDRVTKQLARLGGGESEGVCPYCNSTT